MRTTRLSVVGALLASVAIAAVACGGEPTPTPTAAPIPTATPTAAPASPTATPTPLPPGATPPPPPTSTPSPVPAPTATPIPDFDAVEYFGRKRIVINVGFSPGGGYDTFGRLMGKFLPNHLPGNPTFVVRNIPGAGGERVMRETLSDSPPDGLAVAVAHPRFFKRELVGTDVEHLDIQTVKIVGTASAVNQTSAMYSFKDYATSWADVLAKPEPATVGATAPGDTGGVGAAFIQMVGGPINNVYGYGGTSEIAAAFDRREIDISSRGAQATARSLFPEWIETQAIVPLFRWGADPALDPLFTDYVLNDLGAEIPPHAESPLQRHRDDQRQDVPAVHHASGHA